MSLKLINEILNILVSLVLYTISHKLLLKYLQSNFFFVNYIKELWHANRQQHVINVFRNKNYPVTRVCFSLRIYTLIKLWYTIHMHIRVFLPQPLSSGLVVCLCRKRESALHFTTLWRQRIILIIVDTRQQLARLLSTIQSIVEGYFMGKIVNDNFIYKQTN